MNKTQLNYWIDVVIAAAFIGSASSGLVFLLPLSGSSTVFGVTYATWDTVHTWSSLAMIAGVLAHLVLHWKWIVHMTKKNLGLKRATAVATTNGALSRRDFLHVAGFSILTAAVSGTMLGNYYSQRK
ncbi:MAG: DUF4405 domain-containing protein, partial [Anaerolineales bacterium]|nr:DUF4405 domain-containing protein [Anaerolineales bacterium]